MVQHCCGAADILHEREWDHTNESQTIADEGQVPENDQANQATKQHKQPKHNPNKPNKKPQPNKQEQQNQPFTLVRRRAQVSRPGLEQSEKNSLGCTGMHCVSEECIRFKCRQDEACIGIIGIQEGRQADIAACHTPSHREDPVVSQLQDQNSRPGTIRANLFRSSVQYLEAVGVTLACLATLAQASASFSKSRLCRVRRRFPGSEALRCKGSGIYANCGQ